MQFGLARGNSVWTESELAIANSVRTELAIDRSTSLRDAIPESGARKQAVGSDSR